LLALLGAHRILYVSKIRVKVHRVGVLRTGYLGKITWLEERGNGRRLEKNCTMRSGV
jgi:hypothetical protein